MSIVVDVWSTRSLCSYLPLLSKVCKVCKTNGLSLDLGCERRMKMPGFCAGHFCFVSSFSLSGVSRISVEIY